MDYEQTQHSSLRGFEEGAVGESLSAAQKTPSKQGAVARELDVLQTHISQLEKVIKVHSEKIEPILSPELPKEGSGKGENLSQSGLSQIIAQTSERVRYASHELSSMTDRVEL